MKIRRIVTTIDTHTAGGPTRTITGGLPPLPGNSVAEKMEYFRQHFDPVRKLLMCEPRGHRDMSGAVITDAPHPDADIGAFFLTTAGYLPACVHSAIGVATAGLETGFIPKTALSSGKSLMMEVPAGLVALSPRYSGGKLQSVAIRTPPAFVHSAAVEIPRENAGPLRVSVVFSGVFFVLLDVRQLEIAKPHPGSYIRPQNARDLAMLGRDILIQANRCLKVGHPEVPGINTLDLIMIYEDLDDRHARDIVVSSSGGIDRSPCGAGTGAKVTSLFSQGKLEANQDYILDSFLGTRFIGRAVEAAKVGPFDGAVPEIQGSAFVTGMHQFVLEAEDPIGEGFLF